MASQGKPAELAATVKLKSSKSNSQLRKLQAKIDSIETKLLDMRSKHIVQEMNQTQ
jgi:hypothetical protein